MENELNHATQSFSAADSIAAEVLAAFDSGRSIAPFSARPGSFGLDDAYTVTAALRRLRRARGEIPVGRKIGFTNRAIWPQYGVATPIWGDMFSTTVHSLKADNNRFSLAGFIEPRIEPEIIFKLAAAPDLTMDESDLLGCIEWIGHGFEIVQSVYPGWRFSAADSVAAGGLHGAFLLGPTIARDRVASGDLKEVLARFKIELLRGGSVIDRGCGADVLDGPLSALRHVVDMLAHDKFNPPLHAGELVTTGTLTAAFPIAAGETWTTMLSGIPLVGLSVSFE